MFNSIIEIVSIILIILSFIMIIYIIYLKNVGAAKLIVAATNLYESYIDLDEIKSNNLPEYSEDIYEVARAVLKTDLAFNINHTPKVIKKKIKNKHNKEIANRYIREIYFNMLKNVFNFNYNTKLNKEDKKELRFKLAFIDFNIAMAIYNSTIFFVVLNFFSNIVITLFSIVKILLLLISYVILAIITVILNIFTFNSNNNNDNKQSVSVHLSETKQKIIYFVKEKELLINSRLNAVKAVNRRNDIEGNYIFEQLIYSIK